MDRHYCEKCGRPIYEATDRERGKFSECFAKDAVPTPAPRKQAA